MFLLVCTFTLCLKSRMSWPGMTTNAVSSCTVYCSLLVNFDTHCCLLPQNLSSVARGTSQGLNKNTFNYLMFHLPKFYIFQISSSALRKKKKNALTHIENQIYKPWSPKLEPLTLKTNQLETSDNYYPFVKTPSLRNMHTLIFLGARGNVLTRQHTALLPLKDA